MRVGVIGVGRIGSFHAEVVSNHPAVDSVLLLDADVERAAHLAERIGGAVAPSVDALLEGADAVVIATPTATHSELIRAAVDARRPTFCEKPIAIDLESTDEVIRHVQRHEGVVQVGFQRRFDPGYRRARELVRDGRIGQVYVVRMVGHDAHPPHRDYVPSSGGIFRDLHIHDFDTARFVLGQEIREVYADGANLGGFDFFESHGDVDTAVAVLRFAGGTLGILSGARHNALGYDIRMELFGGGDSVAVGWDERMPLWSVESEARPAPPSPYPSFLDRFAAAYRAELETFVEVATGKVTNPCPPEDARQAMRVAVACDISRAGHRPVALEEIA